MIIRHIRLEATSDRVHVAAEIVWEDVERTPLELKIDAPWTCSSYAVESGDALAVACLHPALYLGEKRMKIEADLCPQLRNGLNEAQAWYRHWFELERPPLKIEAPHAKSKPADSETKQSGLLLSGGVDSLAALRNNMLTVPEDHPARIRRCFVVHGFDIGWSQDAPPKPESFERAMEHLKDVADDAQVELGADP